MENAARKKLSVARKERGLSLRELAGRVGVSASQLSQIESGKSEPSVASLFALVRELGLSVDDLMGSKASVSGTPTLSAAQDRSRAAGGAVAAFNSPHSPAGPADYEVLRLESGVVWERLVPRTDQILETLRVTYTPGGQSSSDGSFSRHEGSEFIHMISGVLTVQLHFRTFEMSGGETLLFPASDPHYFVNRGEEPAVGIWVIVADPAAATPQPTGSADRAWPLHGIDDQTTLGRATH